MKVGYHAMRLKLKEECFEFVIVDVCRMFRK